jgi:murein DD-endopeptidase MepM/ murein hydrolase activator NlpD
LCYRRGPVAPTHSSRAIRILIAVASLVTAAVPLLATGAAGQETLSQLQDRMDALRSDLDATTQRIEDLHAREHEVTARIEEIEREIAGIEKDSGHLEKIAVERADILYRYGSTGVVEALFGSEDLAELATKTEMLSQVQFGDTGVFIQLARTKDRLEVLSTELVAQQDELADTTDDLESEVATLRDQLADIGDEYEELKRRIARERAEAARREAAQEAARREAAQEAAAVQSAPAPAPAPVPPAPAAPSADMVCPVDGPNSFIDSWGYPRSGGRSHEGTDVMADYGTPVVAVVSGTITLSSYGPSAGNWLVLSGNDGNEYWYMHNRENLVNGGSVTIGQQIATVGDTGNATGIPHLHFEYHPGGGGPVNPYPLIRPLC